MFYFYIYLFLNASLTTEMGLIRDTWRRLVQRKLVMNKSSQRHDLYNTNPNRKRSKSALTTITVWSTETQKTKVEHSLLQEWPASPHCGGSLGWKPSSDWWTWQQVEEEAGPSPLRSGCFLERWPPLYTSSWVECTALNANFFLKEITTTIRHYSFPLSHIEARLLPEV